MIRPVLLATAFAIGTCTTQAQKQSKDTLFNNFQTPPNSAKPRVWWHWMNGNITKDGIYKDLTWMHRAGIGGFQNFDAAWATPQIVKDRLVYMTPGWNNAFAFATKLADSLKLEMAIAGSPGWSESGGSWVPKEDGMKKIVWSELRVTGGANNVVLPRPPASAGTFQNIPLTDEFSNQRGKLPTMYKDVVVLAVPLKKADPTMVQLQPKVASSGGHFDLYELTDGNLEKFSFLPADTTSGKAWISFQFNKPITIKAVTIMGGADRNWNETPADVAFNRAIEVSNDGTNYTHVAYLPVGETQQQTIALPTTTGQYFRITFKNRPGRRDNPHPGSNIAELVLHTSSRIQRPEDKAAFATANHLGDDPTPATTDTVALASIIDLTDKLQPDGTLNWQAPAGNWSILRFGYTVMGTTNHPATAEATGFEVDKLDPAAVKRYFTHYLDLYKNATNGLMGTKGGLQYMVTDSWEAGAQNWTAAMPNEFEQRRGYSLLTWLPTLAGYVINNAESSDRFLFDFRKTISEMTSQYHYDQLTTLLASYGMKRYSESHEFGRQIIADGMEVKKTAAIPMSAMWTPNYSFNKNDLTPYESDIRESASVAHIYGQNLVAAESLTTYGPGGAAWNFSPEKLKPTADLELASGLNRFVIHCSTHQPVDDKIPGLGLGPFGQWFNRHDTWAEQAHAWTSYLSRSSYLLQQGKFVADILYYYGEDDNITSLFKNKQPAIPEGYNFDYINSDALLNELTVKDGNLQTRSGMTYRVLVLDSNARRIPLKVLRRLQALAQQGVTITGIKPEHSTGLKDDEAAFQNIVASTWSKPNVRSNQSLADVLASINTKPDFAYNKPTDSTKLLYVHRKLKDRDIYWLNSRNNTPQTIEATFRITGKVPELWHAETGTTSPASYTINPSTATTTVTIDMTPNDAVFVVFKDKATASQQSRILPTTQPQTLTTIDGPWDISFQKDRGAPATATFNTLESYTNNSDPGIKYFSGTATYTKTIDIQPNWIAKSQPLYLDLGSVKNLAEVILNGKSLGILWKTPFTIDISSAAKPGANKLEIKVTNTWVNRLIGDQQPDVTKPITFTTEPYYDADSPLLPAGLLGPVTLNHK